MYVLKLEYYFISKTITNVNLLFQIGVIFKVLNRVPFLLYCSIIFSSCKLHELRNDNSFGRTKGESYVLSLHPQIGSKYCYESANDMEMAIEVNSNTIKRINRVKTIVSYTINKDSARNYLFTAFFDNIKVYSKNGDEQLEMDAANAESSTNPVERMLGRLKSTQIVTSVDQTGNIKILRGYTELTESVLHDLKAVNGDAREQVKKLLDQFIEKGIIMNNMSLLTAICPDSAVHIRDNWKHFSQQNDELGLKLENIFTLIEVDGNVALIKSIGILNRDRSITRIMGQSVTSNLDGEVNGEYKLDIQTGMVISSSINSSIKGSFLTMGKEIPVEVKTRMALSRKKTI